MLTALTVLLIVNALLLLPRKDSPMSALDDLKAASAVLLPKVDSLLSDNATLRAQNASNASAMQAMSTQIAQLQTQVASLQASAAAGIDPTGVSSVAADLTAESAKIDAALSPAAAPAVDASK